MQMADNEFQVSITPLLSNINICQGMKWHTNVCINTASMPYSQMFRLCAQVMYGDHYFAWKVGYLPHPNPEVRNGPYP